MKFIKVLLAITVMGWSFNVSCFAQGGEGGTVGNGGDIDEAAIFGIIQNIIYFVKTDKGKAIFPEVDTTKLSQAVDHTVLGTDFLSVHSYAFDFENGLLYSQILDGAACTAGDLRASGLESLDVEGYYTQNLNQLKKMKDLKPLVQVNPEDRIPNLPMIPVQIGSVTSRALIDTGYSDELHPYSININRSFKKDLDQANVTLIRRPEYDVKISTCVKNVFEWIDGYDLPNGVTFDFIGMQGKKVRIYDDIHFFLKMTPPEAYRCGGISSYDVPMIQLGGSFWVNEPFVIFDPIQSKVWVTSQSQNEQSLFSR